VKLSLHAVKLAEPGLQMPLKEIAVGAARSETSSYLR
jgi:hypothetical protein